MGLVGSLDDLGLGDILQIISLSRKSGVLHLKSSKGMGTIVFCDGLIRRSLVKGGAGNLGELLAAAGVLSLENYAQSHADAQASGAAIETILSQKFQVPEEKIEELRRQNVERAVIQMFQWTDGDFSFEVEESDVSADPALALAKGINAQYLAMEGSRICDEAALRRSTETPSATSGEDDDPFSFASIGEEVRASDPPAAPIPAAVQESQPEIATPAPEPPAVIAEPASAPAPVAFAPVTDPSAVEARPVATPEFADMADILDESLLVEAVNTAVAATPAAPPREGTQRAHAPGAGDSVTAEACVGTVVVADPDRVVGEWVKDALAQVAQRIHVFNDLDPAIQRARQYLARGETPMVVFSGDLPDSANFARRLQKMSPKMRLIALTEPSEGQQIPEGLVEICLHRPSAGELKTKANNPKCAGLAKALLRSVTD